MKCKATDLPSLLRSGPIPAAILLFGQDQGLIVASAATIRHATFSEEHADFDVEVFFGNDLNIERLLSSCQGYPLLAERRLVILKEAERLSAAAVKAVSDYLKRPSPSTLLLVLAGNLDASAPLRKHFENDKKVWCIPFYPLEGPQLRQWLLTQLQQDGLQVEADAMHYLCTHLAGDTRHTGQELDKLKLFMGQKRRIQLEDVLALVGETTTHSGFGLASAITAGQSQEAVDILARLLESGEEPILLLGLISQRLRRLNQARELLAQGQDPKVVASRLQVFWKEQAAFFAQSRALATRHLADGLLDCLELDKKLKGGSDLPPRQVMERFVLRLAVRFGGYRAADQSLGRR